MPGPTERPTVDITEAFGQALAAIEWNDSPPYRLPEITFDDARWMLGLVHGHVVQAAYETLPLREALPGSWRVCALDVREHPNGEIYAWVDCRADDPRPVIVLGCNLQVFGLGATPQWERWTIHLADAVEAAVTGTVDAGATALHCFMAAYRALEDLR